MKTNNKNCKSVNGKNDSIKRYNNRVEELKAKINAKKAEKSGVKTMTRVKVEAKPKARTEAKVEAPVKTVVTESKADDYDYNFKLRMEVARLPEAIQQRVRETGGRYLEIGKPAKGKTCHHVVPYFSCITFRNEANHNEDLDGALAYEVMACTRDNIVELPYKVHKRLHNITFKTLEGLYVKDNEGKKYINQDNMAEYLVGMLSAFIEMYDKCHNHYDDLEVYLKEYAVKTMTYLLKFSDDSKVKVLADVLANDLADMTDGDIICESVRGIVDYMKINYF